MTGVALPPRDTIARWWHRRRGHSQQRLWEVVFYPIGQRSQIPFWRCSCSREWPI